MNLEALWHDLECADYREDLPLWRSLAAQAGGPVLDVGAGTGRVTLELAAGGASVVALDTEPALLAALRHRATGLPVETVVADARRFALGRRFALVLVPMQTLQLLGGCRGRAAFLRCALAHLEPGGRVAAALADAMDCFDEDHAMPPPPDVLEAAGVRYASQLLSVGEDAGRAALRRRREITGPDEPPRAEEVVVHLDRVSADDVAAEAGRLGFCVEPHRHIPETDRYLGSTVVVLRATRGDSGDVSRPQPVTEAVTCVRHLGACLLGSGPRRYVPHTGVATSGAMWRRKPRRPEGSEPFDVTLPDGYDLGERRAAFETAAKDAGWTVERDGGTVIARDVWTDNEDHAAWLVATKAGLSAERVTVWAGRDG